MMKQNGVLALAALCCVAYVTLHAGESAMAVLSAGAVPKAFSSWPEGLDPQMVGGKVVAQFLPPP